MVIEDKDGKKYEVRTVLNDELFVNEYNENISVVDGKVIICYIYLSNYNGKGEDLMSCHESSSLYAKEI